MQGCRRNRILLTVTKLLGVGDDRENHVFVSLNQKIEPPTAVDPSLPDAIRFTVLLGMDRGVVSGSPARSQVVLRVPCGSAVEVPRSPCRHAV